MAKYLGLLEIFLGVFDKLCMPSCCYALPMVDRDVLASRGTFNQCHKG